MKIMTRVKTPKCKLRHWPNSREYSENISRISDHISLPPSAIRAKGKFHVYFHKQNENDK